MARMGLLLPMLFCAAGAAELRNNLPSGESTQTVNYGSRRSDLVVHNHGSSGGSALVLVMHGWFGSATGRSSLCNAARIGHWAQQYGFIGACPDGNGAGSMLKSWNAAGCCGKTVTRDIDDVGFLREVVKYVKERATVTKVYAMGLSNGAMISWRLMCEAADLFDGVAPVAGGYFGGPPDFQVAKSVRVPNGWKTVDDSCSEPDYPKSFNGLNITVTKRASCWHANSYSCSKPPESFPLLHVHGLDDDEEPFELVVAQWLFYGRKVLGCTGPVEKKTIGKATCSEMEGCPGNAGKAALCSVKDLGHTMPTESRHGFDAVQAAWLYWNGQLL